jgi:aubergine-like protein
MFIGIDSIKMLKTAKKYVSASTYDRDYSKFKITEIFKQSETEDVIIELVSESIKQFYLANGCAPSKLIIFRGGTNETERKRIMTQDILPLVKFFKEKIDLKLLVEGFKWTYISVNKKTDTKFFEVGREGLRNPQEGTVVDSGITNPKYYEYYIQNQFVNMGTATPTHFVVLYDNSNYRIEELERISYYMSFYYWGWNGAIRMPAILKYAEMANKFSKENLTGPAKENLLTTPYFI